MSATSSTPTPAPSAVDSLERLVRIAETLVTKCDELGNLVANSSSTTGYWTLIKKHGDYYVWKSTDSTFQLTRNPVPPDTVAGYHSLEALLKLKGCKE